MFMNVKVYRHGSCKATTKCRNSTTSWKFVLLLSAILRIVGIGSAEEESLSVLESDVGAIRSIFSILRAITFNRDLSSVQQRFLSETAPEQDIRTAAFHHPRDDFAFRPGDVHMNPSVRIDPFHLLNFALQFDRLIDVEFSRKSVVGPRSRSE